MFHIIFALVVLLILITLLSAGVYAGKVAGRWQMKKHANAKLGTVAVAEGTVFAVLGLLIAFTFAGANDRYEARKIHIFEEASAYETAYLRVDLLAPNTQAPVRQNIRDYLDARIAIYKALPNIKLAYQYLRASEKIQHDLWHNLMQACRTTNNSATTDLIVPAVNTMFDTANMGLNFARIHSPPFVFFLLVALAILGSFLTGYSIAEAKANNTIHVVSYIVISTLTIFLIINLELPRIGIILLNSFDQVLVDARNAME